MRTATRIIALSLLTAASHDAQALRLDYTLELGLLHSDNITLTPTDPVSENVLIPHIDFSLSETGSNVQAQVSGVLEYRDYLRGTFGNETRGTLNGLVDWTLIPQRLTWTFADNLGLYPVSLRDPDVPGNLQQTNVFTTGPSLRFRITPVLQGQAELRYVDSHAEESADFNSQRLAAALRALFELDPTSRLSGNIEAQDIDFDESLSTDYRRYAAYAGYTRTLNRLDLNLALGYSRLEFDDGSSASAPLARASLDWRASARSTFGLALDWDYSDAAAGIADGAGAFDSGYGGVGIGGAAIGSDVYRERRLSGTYTYQGARLSVAGMLHGAALRYEQDIAAVLDRNEYGATINLGYLLRPRLTVGAIAETTQRDFRDIDTTDRDYRFSLYLAQQMTRHWRWRVDLSHLQRDAGAGADSYDENSIYLRLIYAR